MQEQDLAVLCFGSQPVHTRSSFATCKVPGWPFCVVMFERQLQILIYTVLCVQSFDKDQLVYNFVPDPPGQFMLTRYLSICPALRDQIDPQM